MTAEAVTKEKVSYKQSYSNIKIVGEMYRPDNFDKNKKYPAIIVVHPAGGVKEQVAGLYAKNLAGQGFIALAYDAAYQGESGGTPHFLESPASRVEDVRSSVDYLTTLAFVDRDNIGVLGICAGGGYAFNAAETEMRIKAVATVSAFDFGRACRQGLEDSLTVKEQQQLLKEAAEQRTKEANGTPIKYDGYGPGSLDKIPENAPMMCKQGCEYYLTPIGQHPRSENKYIFSNYAELAAFTAFDKPELISPRPVLFIVGEKAESAYFSEEAYDKISVNKEYCVIPNASHFDLYYKPECVDQAVQKLSEFFAENLKTETFPKFAGPYIELNNGTKIPQLGLGTFGLKDGDEVYNAVLTALKAGYRHVDTAHAYKNERGVGRAIRDSGVPREEIWITSKLWPNEFGKRKTPRALNKMLERLGVDYIDLIYLHQPVGDVLGAWKGLEQALKDGKVRAIGISNFDKDEAVFNKFMKKVEVKPQIMQLECHPRAQRKYWQKKLKKNNIQQENWYPLGGRQSGGKLLRNPVIAEIAKAHKKSPAQIIIRWHIQEGFVVIPGASHSDYIKQNIDVFDFSLSDEEMQKIHSLDKEKRFFNLPYEEQKQMYLKTILTD